MELIDTIDGMTSADYKERFKAEYKQLEIRIDKLKNTINKEKANTLEFELACNKETLYMQLWFMRGYASILRDRAFIEGINLD